MLLGLEPIDRGPGHFNRRNFSGRKVGKTGHYAPAIALGHTAVLLLSEVTGGIHPSSERFLRQLADLHDRRLPVKYQGSWTATSFMAYFLQRLSVAVNLASAAELRAQIARGPRVKPAASAKRVRRRYAC